MMQYISLSEELNNETGDAIIDKLLEIKIKNEDVILNNSRFRYEEDMLPLYCEQVVFRLNTVGGDLYKLFEIFDLIDKLKEQGVFFSAEVSSICYSAGFYLLMKMDEVSMSEYATVMYHSMLTAHNYVNIYDALEENEMKIKLQKKLDKLVLENTNIPPELLKEHQKIDLFMDYDDCVNFGIIKEYEEPKQQMTQEEFDTYVESLKNAIEIIDDIECDEVEDE